MLNMCKPAVLSIACLIASCAIFVLYLTSSEASVPITVERLLMPAVVALLAVSLVAGVIALVLIKASSGALGGRRLALLSIIVPIVAGVAYLRSLSGTEDQEQVVIPSTTCRTNISRLAGAINKVSSDNGGRFPDAAKWCDIILEQLKGDESSFTCPLAEGSRCSYTLNKFAAEAGTDWPEDMVLLFESEPGWNQVGGPELFAAQHKSRRGSVGCVTFANGKGRFISEDNLEELNWNGEKNSEEAEDEDEEEE